MVPIRLRGCEVPVNEREDARLELFKILVGHDRERAPGRSELGADRLPLGFQIRVRVGEQIGGVGLNPSPYASASLPWRG